MAARRWAASSSLLLLVGLLLVAIGGARGASVQTATHTGEPPPDLIAADPRARASCRWFYATGKSAAAAGEAGESGRGLAVPAFPKPKLSPRQRLGAFTRGEEVGGEWVHALDGPTVEDALGSPGLLWPHTRLFLRPYGRFVQLARPAAEGGRRFALYVEVPKSGSSTLRDTVIGQTVAPPPGPLLNATKHGVHVPAFSVVREPLARAVSAYGTVVGRLHLFCSSSPVRRFCPDWLLNETRPFADWDHATHVRVLRLYARFLASGELVRRAEVPVHRWTGKRACSEVGERLHPHDCSQFFYLQPEEAKGRAWGILRHAYSQMYFLSAAPVRIDMIARLEQLPEHLGHVIDKWGLRNKKTGAAPVLGAVNVAEGGGVGRDALLTGMDAETRGLLANYYAQDFECLGYAWPAGVPRRAHVPRSRLDWLPAEPRKSRRKVVAQG